MLKMAIRRLWRLISPDTRAWLVRSTQSSFTVSAAAIISNQNGEVLLLNHVLRPFSGWGFPGGFIEKGEQPEDAIRREIREETGIELSQLRLYTIRTAGTHVEILFLAEADGEPCVRSAEIIEVRWCSPDEIPDDIGEAQKKQILDTFRLRTNGTENRLP